MANLIVQSRYPRRRLALLACTIASFWGLGSPALAQTRADPLCKDPLALSDTRDATGMLGIKACWQAEPNNDRYRFLSDLYAHWVIEALPSSTTAPRDYGGEANPAIIRLFVGKNLSMVSKVRIDIRDPNISFVMPLTGFAYQGRVGQGESWTTDLISDDQSMPYFRINSSTSASVHVNAKATQDIEVRATGAIIDSLRTLSSVVSPGGSLVTTLNRESLQQASMALDNALSRIWAQSVEETQSTSRELSEWYEQSFFLIQVVMPEFVKGARAKTAKGEKFTRWYKLRLSCPRLSIFDAKQQCSQTKNDLQSGLFSPEFIRLAQTMSNRVTAQIVNNYPLSPGKTVRQYLSDHDWYSQFLRAADPNSDGGQPQQSLAADGKVVAPKPALADDKKPKFRTENDYASLCHAIVDRLYAAGLSSFDARIGLWATVTGSSDFVGIQDKFQNNMVCKSLLPPSGETGAWAFHTPLPKT